MAPAASLDQLAVGPIFVVGHHRSGTTWVYDVLTAHPATAGVLESWLFTPSSGLANLFVPDQWRSDMVERNERIHGRPFGLAQLLTKEELALEVRGFAERLLARSLEPEHRYLVEKTPSPYTDVELVAQVFPRARFVHVVRDGRDVAISVRAAAYSWNPGWGYARGQVLGRPAALRRLGHSWSWTYRYLRSAGERLGDRYAEVRFEELKHRPEASIRELFDFCGMPHDDALVARIAAATDFEGSFGGGEGEFRRGGRVGDWRGRFGLVERAMFERGSRGALVESGYARSRLWWLRPRGRSSPMAPASSSSASTASPPRRTL